MAFGFVCGRLLLPHHGRGSREADGGPWWRWGPPVDGPRRRRWCPSFHARGSTVTRAHGTARSRHEPSTGADGPPHAVATTADACKHLAAADAANSTIAGRRATAGPRRRAAAGHEQARSRSTRGHARSQPAAVVPAAERRPGPPEPRPTLSADRRRQAERAIVRPIDHRPDDTAVVSDAAGHWGDEAARWFGPCRDEARTGDRHPGRRHPGRRWPKWTQPPFTAARRRKPPRRRFRHATFAFAQAG
jgi:hypothetical protein